MSEARIIHTEDKTEVQFKLWFLPIWLTIFENAGNFYIAELWLMEHMERLRGVKFKPCHKTVKYY